MTQVLVRGGRKPALEQFTNKQIERRLRRCAQHCTSVSYGTGAHRVVSPNDPAPALGPSEYLVSESPQYPDFGTVVTPVNRGRHVAASGGATDLDNLEMLCVTHTRAKGNR